MIQMSVGYEFLVEDEHLNNMVIAIYQMQRKNSDIGNIGAMMVKPNQGLNNAYQQPSKSYNINGREDIKHNPAQMMSKNTNDPSFNNPQMDKHPIQYIQAGSPTQNEQRKSFPTFVQKNMTHQYPNQNPIIEGKLTNVQGYNQFNENADTSLRNKNGQLPRNQPEETLQSPTRFRNPINNSYKPSAGGEGYLLSAPVTSFSPSRVKGSNNSSKTHNPNFNPSPAFLSSANNSHQQQQNLFSSSNHGKVQAPQQQKNSSVYHSVIFPNTHNQKGQNNFKSLFDDQQKMKCSVFMPSQTQKNNIQPQNSGRENNFSKQIQKKQNKTAFKNGFNLGDLEERFSSGSPSSPMPNLNFNSQQQKNKPTFSQTAGFQSSFYNIKQRPKNQKSSQVAQGGPSFLKKLSEQKNNKNKEDETASINNKGSYIHQNTNTNFKAWNPRPRKESLPWKPSTLNLPNSNSKIKNNSLNGKTMSNSNSNSNLKILDSPLKLGDGKVSNVNSATNLLLNLQSPLKIDTMKNLVNKKNSNVNSRKLDENSPDKIMRQRRTLQQTPRETPRTSVQPSDDPAFKRKPELLFEVTKIVDGEKDEEIKPTRQIEIDDFEIVEKIGKGTYGDVFLAQDRKTRFLCVIKALSKKKIKEMQLQQHVFRQIKIQSYLNHRHITSLFGVFDDKNKIYLVMEFLPDGNMSSNGKKKIKEDQAAYLMQQVCEGLLYMHREDIIHRDIKPQNLLMNNHYVKIGDFGTSVFGNQMRRTVVGCLAYISPQQLTNTPYDDKIDAWSTGILAYELLVGKPPFEDKIRDLTTRMYDGEPIENIKKRIEEKADFPQLKFPPQLNLSEDGKDFIKRLLEPDPFLRPDLKWALKHKFILKGREYQAYLDSQL